MSKGNYFRNDVRRMIGYYVNREDFKELVFKSLTTYTRTDGDVKQIIDEEVNEVRENLRKGK